MVKVFKSAIKNIGNALACGMADLAGMPSVETEGGVPVAWRLFAYGPFTITRGGEAIEGEFTPEAADSIMAHYAAKGTPIPLDSRHFLYQLAQKFGVEEGEVARLLPDGRGTFGFASLEKRADGLWATGAQYVPLARRIMAEGMFRYFSPVLRGLADGRLRITSVAFTNQPALDHLDALAASAEAPAWAGVDSLAASLDAIAASATRSSTAKKEPSMTKLLALIAPLVGMDSIALGADNDVPDTVADKLKALAGEVPKRRLVCKAVCDALALGEDAEPAAIAGALAGLKAKGEAHDSLKARVDALAMEAETQKRAKLVESGLASGKLTQALADSPWLKGQDSVALAAYLEHAPVVVPLDRLPKPKAQGGQPDAARSRVFSLLGVPAQAQS